MFSKDDLIPSWLEVTFYAVLALVILLVANADYLTQTLLADIPTGAEPISAVGAQYTGRLVRFVDGLSYTPASAVFVFWSLVGIAGFSLSQSLYGLYAAVRTNINESTRFLHPKNYRQWKFWLGVGVQFITHTALYVLNIICGLLLGYVLVPGAVIAVRSWLENSADFLYFGNFVASFVLLCLGVIIFGMLLKLLLRRKQFAL